MNKHILASALAGLLLVPVAASAQNAGGAAAGAATGAATGAVVGGPVGAVVGGVAGAAVGGSIAEAERPRFRQYVTGRGHQSYRYRETVRVGAELPEAGIEYYEVPAEYGVRGYRYTVVNDRTVLVDPRTRRVIEVIE
jgi:hypothetical protein